MCITPVTIKRKNPTPNQTEYMPVPCGKCPICKTKRSQQWIFRLKQQDRISSSSLFVTLTYDTQNVPISMNGFMTLNKEHLQLFFKKLRKTQNEQIKYYVAAEYGSNRGRPHYHAIIFNCNDIEKLQSLWTYGDLHTGDVQGASIAYTTSYINKPYIKKQHSRDDRLPEFSLMSKGLGKNYINDATIKYHQEQQQLFVNDGPTKQAMPRYYQDKIFTEQNLKQLKLHAKTILDELEQTKQEEYIKRTGSLQGYDRAQFDKKSDIIQAFKTKSDLRQKL